MNKITYFIALLCYALACPSCKDKDADGSGDPKYPFEQVVLPADFQFSKIIEPANGDMIWWDADRKVHVLRNGAPVFISSLDTAKFYVDVGLVNSNTVYFLEKLSDKSVFYQYNWDTQTLSAKEDLPKCTSVFYNSKGKRFLLRNKPNVLGSTADLLVEGSTGFKTYPIPGSNNFSIFPGYYVSKMVEGAQDTLWAVTSKNGAWGFANDTFVQLRSQVSLAGFMDFFIAPDNIKWAFPGSLWWYGAGGWHSVELTSGSFQRNFIQMQRQPDGTIWIVFDSEIIKFGGVNAQTLYQDLMKKDVVGDPFYGIQAWHLDRSGYHWIQTSKKGVFRAKKL